MVSRYRYILIRGGNASQLYQVLYLVYQVRAETLYIPCEMLIDGAKIEGDIILLRRY